MTRFKRDLNGEFGEFWKKDAEKRIRDVEADFEAGEITIDEHGVARNCIGRVLMDDLVEILAMVTDKVNPVATAAAREAEVNGWLAEYRARKHEPRPEELEEMRATFGPGETVVNVLTGETIKL